jgi:hypothetical protein|tara:strand:+ start:178 stop:471 length:294 start_codon:yes stop_codon:yes gene_type:complete
VTKYARAEQTDISKACAPLVIYESLGKVVRTLLVEEQEKRTQSAITTQSLNFRNTGELKALTLNGALIVTLGIANGKTTGNHRKETTLYPLTKAALI